MWDLIKSFLPRAVQDVLTAIAPVLVTHGYMSNSDTEKFIGAGYFLAMLVINYMIKNSRATTAVQAGAAATGSFIPRADASAIAQGKTP